MITPAPASTSRPLSRLSYDMPPWLWLSVAILLVQLPIWWGTISDFAYSLVQISARISLFGFPVLVALFLVVAAPLGVAVIGLAPAFVPPLRLWLVNRVYPPAIPTRVGALATLDEIRAFLSQHARYTSVQFTPVISPALAFVYPIGFRHSEVRVTSNFMVLWRTNRHEAQAALLHELSHVAAGEHFVTGFYLLYRPFLARGIAPLVGALCFTLLAWTVYTYTTGVLQGRQMPSAMEIAAIVALFELLLVILVVALVGYILFPSILALWCSEFRADQFATLALQTAGDVDRVLNGKRRALDLSHPPRILRRLALGNSPRKRVALLLLFPATNAMLQLCPGLVIFFGNAYLVSNGRGDPSMHVFSAFQISTMNDWLRVFVLPMLFLLLWPALSHLLRVFFLGLPGPPTRDLQGSYLAATAVLAATVGMVALAAK